MCFFSGREDTGCLNLYLLRMGWGDCCQYRSDLHELGLVYPSSSVSPSEKGWHQSEACWERRVQFCPHLCGATSLEAESVQSSLGVGGRCLEAWTLAPEQSTVWSLPLPASVS